MKLTTKNSGKIFEVDDADWEKFSANFGGQSKELALTYLSRKREHDEYRARGYTPVTPDKIKIAKRARELKFLAHSDFYYKNIGPSNYAIGEVLSRFFSERIMSAGMKREVSEILATPLPEKVDFYETARIEILAADKKNWEFDSREFAPTLCEFYRVQ